jgi:hypothetical protein
MKTKLFHEHLQGLRFPGDVIASSDALKSMVLKKQFFWDVMPCGWADRFCFPEDRRASIFGFEKSKYNRRSKGRFDLGYHINLSHEQNPTGTSSIPYILPSLIPIFPTEK